MTADTLQEHKVVLVHSSITCTLLTGILLFLYYSNSLSIVGTYKFLTVLSIIVLAEVIKLSITSKLDHLLLKKLDTNHSSRLKKTYFKSAKQFIKFVLGIVGLTIVYYITIVLFGAPLLTHREETLMLSLTLTCLTLKPAILHLGLDNAFSIFTGSQLPITGVFVDAIKLNIKSVLFCTWLSAFVLPLDWNRPWQAWPIPCVVGALVGYLVAHFITFIKISTTKLKKKIKKSDTVKSC